MARQHRDFGRRQCGKRVREIVHIDFGAAMRLRRKAVHDQHDHASDAPRRRSHRRPSRGGPRAEILAERQRDTQRCVAESKPARVRAFPLPRDRRSRGPCGDRSQQCRHARNGRQAEERLKPLMHEIGPLQLVRDRTLVRMPHGRLRRVGELVAGEQHLARPFEIFRDAGVPERMRTPHRPAGCTHTRCRTRTRSAVLRETSPRTRPASVGRQRGSGWKAIHRDRCSTVSRLAPGAGHCLANAPAIRSVAQERRDECLQPARRSGHCVLDEEHGELPVRQGKTLIASAAMIEPSRRHVDHHGTAIAQAFNRAHRLSRSRRRSLCTRSRRPALRAHPARSRAACPHSRSGSRSEMARFRSALPTCRLIVRLADRGVRGPSAAVSISQRRIPRIPLRCVRPRSSSRAVPLPRAVHAGSGSEMSRWSAAASESGEKASASSPFTPSTTRSGMPPAAGCPPP